MKKLLRAFISLTLSTLVMLGAAVPACAAKADNTKLDKVQEYAESVIEQHLKAAVDMQKYREMWLSNVFPVYRPDGKLSGSYICFVISDGAAVGSLTIIETEDGFHSTFGSMERCLVLEIYLGEKVAFAANGKELDVCYKTNCRPIYVDEFETPYMEMDGCAENLKKSGAKYSRIVKKYHIGYAPAGEEKYDGVLLSVTLPEKSVTEKDKSVVESADNGKTWHYTDGQKADAPAVYVRMSGTFPAKLSEGATAEVINDTGVSISLLTNYQAPDIKMLRNGKWESPELREPVTGDSDLLGYALVAEYTEEPSPFKLSFDEYKPVSGTYRFTCPIIVNGENDGRYTCRAEFPAVNELYDIEEAQRFAEERVDGLVSALVMTHEIPVYRDLWLSNGFRGYDSDGAFHGIYFFFVVSDGKMIGELSVSSNGGYSAQFTPISGDISKYLGTGKKIALAAGWRGLVVCRGKKTEVIYSLGKASDLLKEMDGCAGKLKANGVYYAPIERAYTLKSSPRGEWYDENGKTYFIGADGKKETGLTLIGNELYDLGYDGASRGKYNGWDEKRDGRIFYYIDGIKQLGWVHIASGYVGKSVNGELRKGYWYYFDETKGMLSGRNVIDGLIQRFENDGRWRANPNAVTADGRKVTYEDVALYVSTELSKKLYGGVYVIDGKCVIYASDGSLAAGEINKAFPKAYCIVFRDADYSLYELNKVQKYFDPEKYSKAKKIQDKIAGAAVSQSENRFVVTTAPENMETLQKYIDTLPCKDMIILREGNAPKPE